jgi:predicted membrane channel-forming protein YqfA (hemolysin III family)
LNGKEGLPYFVLLLVEALLVVWWGTLQKRKIPFFAGIGFSALNVLAQLIVLVSVYDINRWFVAFGAGLLIMGIAIYIERSREQLRLRVRELSETLEAWE